MKLSRKSLVIGVIIVTVLASVPAYKQFKAMRSNRLVAHAYTRLQNKDIAACMEKVNTAFRLNPKNPQVVAILEQILEEFNFIEVFALYQSAYEASSKAPQMIERYIELCNKYNLHANAKAALSYACSCEKTTPKMYHSVLKSLNPSKQAKEFNAYTLEAFKHYPKDELIKLNYALGLLKNGTNKGLIAAKELLWELSRSELASARLNAILYLSNHYALSNHEKWQLREALSYGSEKLSLQDQLLQGELEIKMLPYKKQKCIEKVITKFKQYQGQDLVEVARWLRRHDELNTLIEMLPQEQVYADQNLLIVYLDALAGLGKWTEVNGVLANSDAPLEPLARKLFQVRTAIELNHLDMAAIHWKALLSEANKNPKVLKKVGNYFASLGVWRYSIEAYEAALMNGRYKQSVVNNLIQIAGRSGDVMKIKTVISRLKQKFPDEDALRGEFVYLQLLLDESIEAAYPEALSLYQKNPSSIEFKSTLALACLKKGLVDEAFELYPEFNDGWVEKSPRWNAILAAVLKANQKPTEAARIAIKINYQLLSNLEQELLKDVL